MDEGSLAPVFKSIANGGGDFLASPTKSADNATDTVTYRVITATNDVVVKVSTLHTTSTGACTFAAEVRSG